MKLHGKTLGLKRSQTRSLERLFRRRVTGRADVTPEIARAMSEISGEINRRVGLLIDRPGRVVHVCVGDRNRIGLPDQVRQARSGKERLCGLRWVHTKLRGEKIDQPDLTALVKFRLDLSTQVFVEEDGLPGTVFRAHLLPPNREDKMVEILGPTSLYEEEEFEFRAVVDALEEEFAAKTLLTEKSKGRERALLVTVSTGTMSRAKDSMEELAELARTSGALVVDKVVQRRPRLDSRTLVGRGMLQEISLIRLRTDADLVVFDRELTPAQARNLERELSTKVIDRTQLILDIFAQRAVTAEGKLQVELARLKYLLPHLTYGRDALAQIRGGIGSNRGLGEKKSELDRRSVRDRVKKLEIRIQDLSRKRSVMRKRRRDTEVATVAIVGYTNAGKSTLFNRLTGADVRAEDLLFATLGTTARKLELPGVRRAIVTDTVGFIQDLPRDLVAAFQATLEELGEADLLLHLADASNPRVYDQVASVCKILEDMGFGEIPRLLVYNKRDRVDEDDFGPVARREDALLISAWDAEDLEGLRLGLAMALLSPPRGRNWPPS